VAAGLAGSVVLGLAGSVVVVFGVVLAGCAGVEPVAGLVPVALELPEVGVLAGVEAGSVVIGVGSGGNGFDRMPAIIWSSPSRVSLLRNLYQVLRLSIHVFLAAAY
jgi:hypothetical protein